MRWKDILWKRMLEKTNKQQMYEMWNRFINTVLHLLYISGNVKTDWDFKIQIQ